MTILSILLVFRHPDYNTKEKEVKPKDIQDVHSHDIDKYHNEIQDYVSYSDAFCSCRFWTLCVMFFQGTFTGLFLASVYKSVALGHLSD